MPQAFTEDSQGIFLLTVAVNGMFPEMSTDNSQISPSLALTEINIRKALYMRK